MEQASWFERYYGEHYADSVRGMLTEERSEREVEFILGETGAQPPAHVLDLACGAGRHSLAFARRGFTVTGVDLNAKWIEAARDAAGTLDATFVAGDMRNAFGGPYDVIVSLFHSFGFFSDTENQAMLEDWTEQLRAGGWLAMDVWNRDGMLRRWAPAHDWSPSAELTVRERRDFDPLTSRVATHYTYQYASGVQHEYDASFRVYTFTELRDLLARGGLTVERVFGSLSGEPYSLDARRLVVFARKQP